MERILKADEKIRKAEEIYYRRKMGFPNNYSKIEDSPKRYLGSKIILQLLIILNISLIIIAIQHKDYIFTNEFLQNVSEYNINLTQSIKALIGLDEEKAKIESFEIESTQVEEFNTVNEVVPNNEAISSLNQMDLDIENIRKSYSFIKPIQGTVTSFFGARESKYQNVRGYHTGIDVGAKSGTSIVAATSRKSCFSIK